MLDSYENILTEGTEVAYNWCGYVKKGIITYIDRTKKSGPVFHVKQYGARNIVSHVKNINSIIKI